MLGLWDAIFGDPEHEEREATPTSTLPTTLRVTDAEPETTDPTSPLGVPVTNVTTPKNMLMSPVGSGMEHQKDAPPEMELCTPDVGTLSASLTGSDVLNLSIHSETGLLSAGSVRTSTLSKSQARNPHYPGVILKIPRNSSTLPPKEMRSHHPVRVTAANTGDRLVPGVGGEAGWVPPGCGCWLDKTKLIMPIPQTPLLSAQKLRDPPPAKKVTPFTCLSPCQMHMLVDSLPSHLKWMKWSLVFSADEHGFLLSTLKRKLAAVSGEKMVVLKTTDDDVFGCFITTSPDFQKTGLSQGGGETYVWRFINGKLEPFRWVPVEDEDGMEVAGGLHCFLSTLTDGSIVVGGDMNGLPALIIGGDLKQGRTGASATFNSPVLAASHFDSVEPNAKPTEGNTVRREDSTLSAGTPHSSEARFTIAYIEVWSFEVSDEMCSPVRESPNTAEVQETFVTCSSKANDMFQPVHAVASTTWEETFCRDLKLCTWHETDPAHHVCCLQG